MSTVDAIESGQRFCDRVYAVIQQSRPGGCQESMKAKVGGNELERSVYRVYSCTVCRCTADWFMTTCIYTQLFIMGGHICRSLMNCDLPFCEQEGGGGHTRRYREV